MIRKASPKAIHCHIVFWVARAFPSDAIHRQLAVCNNTSSVTAVSTGPQRTGAWSRRRLIHHARANNSQSRTSTRPLPSWTSSESLGTSTVSTIKAAKPVRKSPRPSWGRSCLFDDLFTNGSFVELRSPGSQSAPARRRPAAG